jgi:hypothetical protein
METTENSEKNSFDINLLPDKFDIFSYDVKITKLRNKYTPFEFEIWIMIKKDFIMGTTKIDNKFYMILDLDSFVI